MEKFEVKQEVKAVDIPEWGRVGERAVHIRRYTTKQILTLNAVTADNVKEDPRAAVIDLIYAICDEDGKLIFEDTPEDIESLCSLDFRGKTRLSNEITEYNGLGEHQTKN